MTTQGRCAGARARALRQPLFLLAVVLSSGGCSAVRAPIVVGAVYNLAGGQAALDVPSAQGARLAADEANSGGGVLGRRIELVVENGETDPAVVRARTAALLAAHPGLPGIVGLSDTNMVLAAAPVAAADRRVFLTSGATSPLLPQQVPEYLFLACFADNVQAAAAAEWAYEKRAARTAAVVYSSADSYTLLLQRFFRTRFEQLGGTVVALQSYTPDALSPTLIDGLVPADVIYLAAQPSDAIAVTRMLRAAGITTPILGGDAFDSNAWQAYPEIRDVFFTTHAYLGADSNDPRVIAFRAAYAKAYPGSTPDAFAALGYDATRLLIAAIGAADSSDAEAVRAALGRTHDFPGVTGTISYAPGDRIPTKPVTILAIDGGERRFVEQLVPSSVPPP